MVNESLEEIEITYENFKELGSRRTPGSEFQNDRTAPYLESRQKDFNMKMKKKITETIFETDCLEHYKLDITYKINVINRTVDFLPSRTNKNLCETTVAKNELEFYETEIEKNREVDNNFTTVTPTKKKTRPRKFIKPKTAITGSSTDSNIKKADHHIIPRDLIDDFLNIPIDDSKFDQAEFDKIDNKCTKTLILRLKNFDKMMLIGACSLTKKELGQQGLTYDVDIEGLVDDDYSEETKKKRTSCWSDRGGNIFRGPSPGDRRPFDPNMQYDKYGFEDDLQPIVIKTHERYSQLVYENIRQFVEQHSEMNDFDERIKKTILMTQFKYSMEGFYLTSYDPDQ